MLPTTATPRPATPESLVIWVSPNVQASDTDPGGTGRFASCSRSPGVAREDERVLEPLTAEDIEIIAAQLQRPPRGLAGLAYRCPCGKPAVVTTAPRLADGTPFPTTYYLTCPRAHAACSTLESRGLMAAMSRRLSRDAGLAEAYRHAHQAYLADREKLGDVPEIADVSAGGMPDRVKCLHALVAHALAAGRGVNPLGDETLDELGQFWMPPCLEEPS
jgi:uncharacterized protein